MRSFRSALAFRVAVQALAAAVVVLAGAALYLRVLLLSNVDSSLFEVAELQAPQLETSGDVIRMGAGPVIASGAAVSTPQFWAQLVSAGGQPGPLSSNLHDSLPVPSRALETAQRGNIGFET